VDRLARALVAAGTEKGDRKVRQAKMREASVVALGLDGG
jgi:hypothetical protein